MLIIRPYTPRDKAAVLELIKLNTPKYFAPTEIYDLENYLEGKIEDYFVVEDNNEILGSGGINYFYKNKAARISWDIIKPSAQGKGIGTMLTKHRIELLNKRSWLEPRNLCINSMNVLDLNLKK